MLEHGGGLLESEPAFTEKALIFKSFFARRLPVSSSGFAITSYRPHIKF
jgi:hypothetical protein